MEFVVKRSSNKRGKFKGGENTHLLTVKLSNLAALKRDF
jgi:hypothetical protein